MYCTYSFSLHVHHGVGHSRQRGKELLGAVPGLTPSAERSQASKPARLRAVGCVNGYTQSSRDRWEPQVDHWRRGKINPDAPITTTLVTTPINTKQLRPFATATLKATALRSSAHNAQSTNSCGFSSLCRF